MEMNQTGDRMSEFEQLGNRILMDGMSDREHRLLEKNPKCWVCDDPVGLFDECHTCGQFFCDDHKLKVEHYYLEDHIAPDIVGTEEE